jgi:DNA polymerase IIIc chi subunit
VRLDARLWEFSASSFVPHGRAQALPPERAARQPVLLGSAWPAANGADFLMQIGDDLPDALDGLRRAAFLFSENDLVVARARWRTVKALPGLQPVYWREGESGRFEKVA